jgi:hypothetical protein
VKNVKCIEAAVFLNLVMFIHSFLLFSIYLYTGATKDVEMVIIDVKVSVRITDAK